MAKKCKNKKSITARNKRKVGKTKKFDNAQKLYLTQNMIAKKVVNKDLDSGVLVDKTIYYPKTKSNLEAAQNTGRLKPSRKSK